MEEKVKTPVFDRLLPIAGLSFGLLALFVQGAPDWIKYTASSIGLVLAIAWLFSKVGWVGRAIKFRLFRSKLSKDQAVRLSVLLDEISNHMSYSYTLSPFYVWHSCSNDHSDKLRMNYSYHGAIQNWLNDLKERLSDPRNNTLLLIGSLSKAVFEAARLAEQVERELNDLLQEKGLSENAKRKIQKDWESARGHFNQWIDKWQTLFKEIEKSVKTGGAHYIRPLGMIG
jgi:hypothetical protein